MSIIKSEDSSKWINAFIVFVSLLVGYVWITFAGQLGEWFDLEAKIPRFLVLTQISGIVFGIGFFIFIKRNVNASQYLSEVYGELVKVIWPKKDDVLKVTVGIVIGITITSCLFVLVDYIFRQILGLIY